MTTTMTTTPETTTEQSTSRVGKSYRLHILLRTLTPLSIATPGEMRVDVGQTHLPPVYGNPKATPCTPVQKLNVLHDGKIVQVPMIAANNIIGRLRRHAAKLVLDVISGKGQKVQIGTFSALTCGAVTGKPDGRDVTFQEYRETRAHPYIGLMGGGPRMMRRHVRCFNAVPYCDATAGMFDRIRHPHLDDDINSPHKVHVGLHQILQRWIMNRNDDLKDLVDMATAKASIQNFQDAVMERQAQIIGDSARGAEGEKKDRISTESFTALEFIVPGITFPLSFELLDVDEAQLGLFLASLDRFADIERMGGYSRNGFGQLAFNDVVLEDGEGRILEKNLFMDSRLNRASEHAARALQAWADAAKDLDAADLDRLFAPPVDKVEKPTKATKAESADKGVEA